MSPGPTHESSARALADALRRLLVDPTRSALLYPIFGRFCHDFRNHLNSIHMSLYMARRLSGTKEVAPEVWEGIDAAYVGAKQMIERLQSVCNPQVLTTVKLPLSAFFEDRRSSWSERLEAHGRRLLLRPPPPPEAAGLFDPMRLTQGMDDLVAWRAAVGNSTDDLQVEWSVKGGEFLIAWDEPLARPAVPRPRLPTTTTSWESQTLEAFTLPLLTGIMSAHGGSLNTDDFASDPWRLTMRWPLEARPTTREKTPCSASFLPL